MYDLGKTFDANLPPSSQIEAKMSASRLLKGL